MVCDAVWACDALDAPNIVASEIAEIESQRIVVLFLFGDHSTSQSDAPVEPNSRKAKRDRRTDPPIR
jgi:hypothetical protein